MKSIFLLLSLAWFGTSFAQGSYHFLLTANTSIRITDPICKEMAEKSKEELFSQIKKINQNQKKKELAYINLTQQQQAYFEMIKSFGADPEDLFPAFPLTDLLFKTYRASLDEEMYFSMQKVTLKSLGDADIEVSIKNVQVSCSETALDIEVRNLKKPGTPIQTKHLSCPTGRMMLYNYEMEFLPWLVFWKGFYSEVKARDWLEQAILNVEPNLVSQAQRDIQIDEKIKQIGLNSKEHLTKGTEQVRQILKEIPHHIPFDEIVAVLVSQDQQKLSFLTYHQYSSELFYEDEYSEEDQDEYTYIQMTKWNVEKKDGKWGIYYSYDERDSLDHIRTFYTAGFDSVNRFSEENWIKNNFNKELLVEDFTQIQLVTEEASPEITTLVRTEIQPKLADALRDRTNSYDKFYQRIEQQTSDYWDEQFTTINIYKNVLISNPEKTAFIYPVLLHYDQDDSGEEGYSTEEDFKFFVLLKNADGSYKLYDWYYFKPLPYWYNYSLLRCAESHLKHISNFTEDQEIINDQAFWDNYLFKKSARGYEYLTEVVSIHESISLTKSEFDATVQDCIDILLEYDVVDLYDHQLKQIIRCVNTIQKGNLSGAQNTKLVSLSQELHFQKRLNRIQKSVGNYYPKLDLEFGVPMLERSYYQIH
jgi:hypothetical protein